MNGEQRLLVFEKKISCRSDRVRHHDCRVHHGRHDHRGRSGVPAAGRSQAATGSGRRVIRVRRRASRVSLDRSGRQLHDGVIGTNADVSEVAATQAALVGDGTDDGTGHHAMTLTDAMRYVANSWPSGPRERGAGPSSNRRGGRGSRGITLATRRCRRLGREQEGVAVARLHCQGGSDVDERNIVFLARSPRSSCGTAPGSRMPGSR